MIRHASHSGTVTATSLGVHGATARGCLIASASFPSPVAPGLLGAGSPAVNLASVAPTTDKHLTTATSAKKNPARYFINTCVRAFQTLAILVLCVGKFQQYWALREGWGRPSATVMSATTGFRGQPSGLEAILSAWGAVVKPRLHPPPQAPRRGTRRLCADFHRHRQPSDDGGDGAVQHR
jgi:hypothetical protein